MLWEVGQAGQPSSIEPGDIDVVGMVYGDGHLMSGLPVAKQAGLGVLDGGDARSW